MADGTNFSKQQFATKNKKRKEERMRERERENSWANTVEASRMLHLQREE